MKIWVDDIREPPVEKGITAWCKTSRQAVELLERSRWVGRTIDIMSLDHDLGGDDTTRPIVLWMCENDWWPTSVVVHSANPPGRFWLEQMIERYHPSTAPRD